MAYPGYPGAVSVFFLRSVLIVLQACKIYMYLAILWYASLQGGADPLWPYFSNVAGQVCVCVCWGVTVCVYYTLFVLQQDGQIDAEELQRCLTQSGMTGSYQREQ